MKIIVKFYSDIAIKGLKMKSDGSSGSRGSFKMLLFMSFGMALFMSMGMSFVMTVVNIGVDAFPWIWLRSWGIGFAVALPLSFLLPVVLRSLARRLGVLHEQRI